MDRSLKPEFPNQQNLQNPKKNRPKREVEGELKQKLFLQREDVPKPLLLHPDRNGNVHQHQNRRPRKKMNRCLTPPLAMTMEMQRRMMRVFKLMKIGMMLLRGRLEYGREMMRGMLRRTRNCEKIRFQGALGSFLCERNNLCFLFKWFIF